MNRLSKEPVTAAVLVPVIVWLATYFGFNVDEETATAIAGALLVLIGLFARQRVTPLADPHDNAGRKLVPADTKIARIKE